MNRKSFDNLGFIISWFAVITQFTLMIQNRQTNVLETIIRFFSFFTILTNTLVALYFTISALKIQKGIFSFLKKIGSITAITVFILLVGIVYQVILRSVWKPEGLQKLVDELLHTIIPLFVLVYWYLFSKKEDTNFNNFKKWLIYPFVYFFFILSRGYFSGFYPYPFVNANELEAQQIVVNFILITTFVLFLFVILSLINRKIKSKVQP